ncbi:MAG: hypothetical protein U1E26_08975 [Coriobacteriia bacterium]|nr:hypothetical protein [Coriobacteriia bacterium]
MRLETSEALYEAHSVTHVRVDKIGGTAAGLWWVAVAFEDGSSKPEGLFTTQDEAMKLAAELAASWHVEVQVTSDL